jgi:hypothetical protein
MVRLLELLLGCGDVILAARYGDRKHCVGDVPN